MSAKRLIQTLQARLDLRKIVAELTIENPERAARFYAAYKETRAFLHRYPEGGQRCPFTHPRLANLRWKAVRDFDKYLIFTDYDGETIRIVRVLHAAQNIEAMLEDESE